MMERKSHLLRVTLLFAVALLLAPKVILIDYFSSRWVDTDPLSIGLYLLQDLLLAALFYLLAFFLLRRYRYSFVPLCAFAGALLLLLLIDMRVRELWLKPLDWPLVQYSLEHASDLTSGVVVFFNQLAGFGFTFRFIVFVSCLAWLGIWLLVGLASYRASRHPPQPMGRAGKLSVIAVLITLLLGAALARDARYHLNQNIVASPLITVLHSAGLSNDPPTPLLLPFEQPVYPLSAINPQSRPDIGPGFNNLVFIVMESVRWNSTFASGIDTAERYPTLARLAREGMLYKSYVTVPHSSKSYFSIFTAKHAYPGVEIKEAMPLYQPGIIHTLTQHHDRVAVAFSSLHLQFENMEGFLTSIGVSKTYAVGELSPASESGPSSSFGSDDAHLYLPSIPYLQAIQQTGKGFVALYFPHAAHYPYDCPGTRVPTSELDKYEACIENSDALIGQMLAGFDAAGLLDSTLFVLVGDHGESFGEHGMFIHNASMHEEEVAVPLIFWAKDRTLPKPTSNSSQQTDIAPTLADFFGVTDADFQVQGISLLRPHGKRALFMATFFDRLSSALVEPPYKYIYEYSADTLLRYNLEDDPWENDPQLVTGDEFTATKNRLLSYDAYQKALFDKASEQHK